MRVVYWGTYDTGKPRNRLMIKGLQENGAEVVPCHSDIWSGIEDKSQLAGRWKKLAILIKWLLSYPGLLFRYCRIPRHDAVIIGYMGQLDVLIIWPFAKARQTRIIWDAFLSLYNTVVEDRKLFSPSHPVAKILFSWNGWPAGQLIALFLILPRTANTFTGPSESPPERLNVFL